MFVGRSEDLPIVGSSLYDNLPTVILASLACFDPRRRVEHWLYISSRLLGILTFLFKSFCFSLFIMAVSCEYTWPQTWCQNYTDWAEQPNLKTTSSRSLSSHCRTKRRTRCSVRSLFRLLRLSRGYTLTIYLLSMGRRPCMGIHSTRLCRMDQEDLTCEVSAQHNESSVWGWIRATRKDCQVYNTGRRPWRSTIQG